MKTPITEVWEQLELRATFQEQHDLAFQEIYTDDDWPMLGRTIVRQDRSYQDYLRRKSARFRRDNGLQRLSMREQYGSKLNINVREPGDE